MKEGQHNNIQKLHVTTMSVQLRKLVSQVGLVKKMKEDKKNLWITVGIANSCLSQKNLKKKKEKKKKRRKPQKLVVQVAITLHER